MSRGNFSEFQFAYGAGYSTEAALLKVTNDVVTFVCYQLTTVILSLSVSAAFDTINQRTLLDRITQDTHPITTIDDTLGAASVSSRLDYANARHIDERHQQAAGGTELAGQSGVSDCQLPTRNLS